MAANDLAYLPGGKLNLAYEAVDRHVMAGRGDNTAFRFINQSGERKDINYLALMKLSNQFANVLRSRGVEKGDRVFTLLGRVPETYITALGTLKNGSVYSPLFSAFGSEPIAARMGPGQGRVLVTTLQWYLQKIMPIRKELESLEFVFLLGDSEKIAATEGVIDFRKVLLETSTEFQVEATAPSDTALIHFTSGTTGKPKGAVHAHQAAIMHLITGKYVLDMQQDDIYWCTADPGWVTGTSYGIFSPLLNGITSVVDEGEFDVTRWYDTLVREKVTIWYTAPTAIRMLMRAGVEVAQKYSFPALRLIGSVGEPLNPEAVTWGMKAFGLPIHDNWWQTETGGIMIANYPCMDIKPGSMGKPVPGVEVAIVKRQDDKSIVAVTAPGEEGELAMKVGWSSMFRAYLNQPERYESCFYDGWYLTGDLAKRDDEGYYWFVGRADDVIKSAGHLVGPFEVESVLMEHPAVAEAAVIGKPDPVVGEVIKAFVALRAGYAPGPELEKEILGHARKRLGVAIAPKEVVIQADLPKTRSGKIMRRLLKARELGLPEGDTSTLAKGA